MMKKISYIFILFISLFIVSNVVKADTICTATDDMEFNLTFNSNGDLITVKDRNGNELFPVESSATLWDVKSSSGCPTTKFDYTAYKTFDFGYGTFLDVAREANPNLDKIYDIAPITKCMAVGDMKYNLFLDHYGKVVYVTDITTTEIPLSPKNSWTLPDGKCPIAQYEFYVKESDEDKGYYLVWPSTDYTNRVNPNYDNIEGCSVMKDKSNCVSNPKYSCVWVDRKSGKVLNSEAESSTWFESYCNVDNLQYVQCGNSFDIPVNIPSITSFVINLLKILTPIILVFTSAITLLKAITANKEDEMNKAKDTLVRRIIIAVFIFFTITITQFVINKVAEPDEAAELGSCLNCFINNNCGGNTYYKNNINGEYQCFYTLNSTAFEDQSKCH